MTPSWPCLLLLFGGRAACTADFAARSSTVPTAASALPQASPAVHAEPLGSEKLVVRAVPLPAAKAPAFLDYIAYERAARRVWVPVPSSGSVEVLTVGGERFDRVEGFATSEVERRGRQRTLGPSAVAVGDRFAYVGNRATAEICPVELASLRVHRCLKAPGAIDGVAYVARNRQIWVTLPEDKSLAVLDASEPATLKLVGSVRVPGQPEGYAVDDGRGIFYTNLEDGDASIAIDVAERRVLATWKPGCGPDGPRGIALDAVRNLLVVACTEHLQVLDAGRGGRRLGRLDTGAGLDNLDFLPSKQLVYAAAGRAARLTIVHLADAGELSVVAAVATAEGARNAVVDEEGTAYVADPLHARLLIVRSDESAR